LPSTITIVIDIAIAPSITVASHFISTVVFILLLIVLFPLVTDVFVLTNGAIMTVPAPILPLTLLQFIVSD
jgi:hypothetical protein